MSKLTLAVLLLAGATAADARRTYDPLAGRVATKTSRCIQLQGNQPLTIQDPQTLIYRESGRRVWRNVMPEACLGLDFDDILVVEPFGGQLCRNDRVRGIDRTSHIPSSFCRLGDFVAYEKPKTR